jgi:hypothetical protein
VHDVHELNVLRRDGDPDFLFGLTDQGPNDGLASFQVTGRHVVRPILETSVLALPEQDSALSVHEKKMNVARHLMTSDSCPMSSASCIGHSKQFLDLCDDLQ